MSAPLTFDTLPTPAVIFSHAHSVLRTGPYRFYFYSHDLINEPPHIYVDRNDSTAKFWLNPIALANNLGFGAKELRKIEKVVREHQSELLERWYKEYGRATGSTN